METKIKKDYFVYLLLFTIYFIFVSKLIRYISSLVKNFEYPFSPWTYFVIIFFINLVFGVLLGLEHFRTMKKNGGKWKVNVQKLIVLGIQALLISSSHFIFYSGSLPRSEWLMTSFFMLVDSKNPTLKLVQVLLGYTLVTSIYKEHDIE